MSKRLSQKNNLMVSFALQQAKLSKCKDKKTAAILVSADMQQIYSIGINGGPKGSERECMCGESTTGKAKYTCVHAEMNCLIKNTTKDVHIPKFLICTKQPCAMCASLIINADLNIQEVQFVENYWDATGIQILNEAGIKVTEVTVCQKL